MREERPALTCREWTASRLADLRDLVLQAVRPAREAGEELRRFHRDRLVAGAHPRQHQLCRQVTRDHRTASSKMHPARVGYRGSIDQVCTALWQLP